MPYYEYRCGANGRTLEVRHGMAERLQTWGDLASLAGLDPGDTPIDEPVERLLSAPVPLKSPGQGPEGGFRGCGSGCGCVPQS